ncbi:MAG: hypothetical protein Lokiarch_17980 [Candidatus Lokiarchaeum sp. GC14_75]|nr:MAG: hypothetical protein Lokiarch_17980 [Candidatus Lokiarchaeum sp. GC14_75]
MKRKLKENEFHCFLINSNDITSNISLFNSLGHLGFKDVQISKDTVIPVIIIYHPLEDGIFRNTPPDFNISIIEEDLVSTWYTIDGGITNYTFTGTIGTIDQDAWNVALEGQINITFYAQDSAGNIGTTIVHVTKSVPSEPAIPGYNLFLLIGVISVASIIIVKIQKTKFFKGKIEAV